MCNIRSYFVFKYQWAQFEEFLIVVIIYERSVQEEEFVQPYLLRFMFPNLHTIHSGISDG